MTQVRRQEKASEVRTTHITRFSKVTGSKRQRQDTVAQDTVASSVVQTGTPQPGLQCANSLGKRSLQRAANKNCTDLTDIKNIRLQTHLV
jgi:hypothetical protein